MRVGISWRDLIAGLLYCVKPTSRFIAYREAISAWSDRDDCLIALSVRSAFDQLLQRLALQEGDEVLLSAWTVPGMVRIVEAHGLVPVPVDVDRRGNVSLASMENAITSRSRVCVIAHLFGGHANLEEVIPVLKERAIFLVEDCAQSFDHLGDIGHPASDAVLHSFGPIKTATSLGGAVVRIPDSELRRKVIAGIAEQPVQSQLTFAKRVFRFAALKLLSGKFASRVMFGLLSRINVDVDRMINSLGRGFTDSKILTQIRFQPATPLL
ncbi:MAG: DegT/DnrJ/EryC1/StrS family aminotransferase, partial [Planctomycetota bacterium]